MFELKTMSPASEPPLYGGGRKANARAEPDCGIIAIRMSPNRGSSCWLPSAPIVDPSSVTCAILMLAYDDQMAPAFWNADSQVAVLATALRVEKRLLDTPPTLVPSGTKL